MHFALEEEEEGAGWQADHHHGSKTRMRCTNATAAAGCVAGAGSGMGVRVMRHVRANGERQHLVDNTVLGEVQREVAGKRAKGFYHMREAVPKVEFETRAQWHRERRAKSRW